MKIIKNTQTYYEKRNEKYGKGSPLNLWATEERQIERFEKLASIFDFTNYTIFDVGCGYGDFYNFLMKKNIVLKAYKGIDLLKEHCEIARLTLPKNCRILEGDFLETTIKTEDYFILSGTLNFYEEGWFDFAHKVLDKMWELCNVGMAFNLRSPYGMTGSYKQKTNQAKDMDPTYWCSYAHNKTSKYSLYHDYVNYDYTVVLWKQSVHKRS